MNLAVMRAHVPDHSLAIAIDVIASEMRRRQITIDDPASPEWAVEQATHELAGMRTALAALTGVLGRSPTFLPMPTQLPASAAIEWSRRVLEEDQP